MLTFPSLSPGRNACPTNLQQKIDHTPAANEWRTHYWAVHNPVWLEIAGLSPGHIWLSLKNEIYLFICFSQGADNNRWNDEKNVFKYCPLSENVLISGVTLFDFRSNTMYFFHLLKDSFKIFTVHRLTTITPLRLTGLGFLLPAQHPLMNTRLSGLFIPDRRIKILLVQHLRFGGLQQGGIGAGWEKVG